MKYLLLILLVSCGQSNQALDCIRQGEQCSDPTLTEETPRTPVPEPQPCTVVSVPDIEHPVEITVEPVEVIIEDQVPDVVVFECRKHHKHWKHRRN